jgi:hypothetical protein
MISTETGRKFSEAHRMAFFETSAANGSNVKEMFEEIVRRVMESQNGETSQLIQGNFEPSMMIEISLCC